jgi:TPR repeat protein
MAVEQRLTLSGVIVAVLLSASSAFAGALEDANAAYDRKDYTTAVELFRPLAEQGNAKAQDHLGLMYANGQGVAWDDSEATKWYRKAAEQGDADAQFNLGASYQDGFGVARDYRQAAAWYRKAADQGDSDAQFNLALRLAASRALDAEARKMAVTGRDDVAAKMTPEQIAEAQRLAREWKLAIARGDRARHRSRSTTSFTAHLATASSFPHRPQLSS